MTTREIRPSTAPTICDVCGRTLLRGERAEAYVHGGARRWVCELCKSRALHEGWVREGTLPAFNAANSGSDRRRSLLGRLLARREPDDYPPPAEDEDLDGYGSPSAPSPPMRAQSSERRGRRGRESRPERGRESRAERGRESRTERGRESSAGTGREPRHIRAVPTSAEHRSASAVDLFNASEHPRTVAGVARSLGLPTVSVSPAPGHTSLVSVVVSWELCWYRYEVDLSDEVPSVRVNGQGYELDELAPEERVANAVASDDGKVVLAG